MLPSLLFGVGVFVSKADSMTDDVTIRQVESRDHDAIARLWQTLTDEHVQLDPRLPVAVPGAAESYAERLLERRDDPFTRTFVATVGDQVVGYILGAVIDLTADLFEYEDSGFIADVFVNPAYRRRGIARQLVETMNRWFAERGVFRVEWQVASANLTAIRFWEAVGGRPITIRMRVSLDRNP
jgi:ribosomal protein S18 acetylase RimI-like enzyme